MNGGFTKLATWTKNYVGESGLVGRVRKVLRLQAKRFVPMKAATHRRAVKIIGSVELDAGLCRENFHHAPRVRFDHAGGRL